MAIAVLDDRLEDGCTGSSACSSSSSGSARSAHPYDTFATLAALIGFFLLFKGIFDLTVAFITKDEFELWWLQLVIGLIEILLAFWVAGDFNEKAILLVIYVGIIALSHGITEIFLAFKLKGLGAARSRRPDDGFAALFVVRRV